MIRQLRADEYKYRENHDARTGGIHRPTVTDPDPYNTPDPYDAPQPSRYEPAHTPAAAAAPTRAAPNDQARIGCRPPEAVAQVPRPAVSVLLPTQGSHRHPKPVRIGFRPGSGARLRAVSVGLGADVPSVPHASACPPGPRQPRGNETNPFSPNRRGSSDFRAHHNRAPTAREGPRTSCCRSRLSPQDTPHETRDTILPCGAGPHSGRVSTAAMPFLRWGSELSGNPSYSASATPPENGHFCHGLLGTPELPAIEKADAAPRGLAGAGAPAGSFVSALP